MPEVTIEYPYMPAEGTIVYVGLDNDFMAEARAFAEEASLDKAMPNASIVVKDGVVIGRGANGSTYHETNVCERVKLGMPSGQGYELCEGCSPSNHGEPSAIANAVEHGATEQDLQGAEIYLWGHWWCCEPCWGTMLDNGINTVYLLEDSEKLFNKEHPDNIVGRQFDI
nr:Cytidine and deoxycytidylate deaminase zinc-binding region [uncultured bacterium]